MIFQSHILQSVLKSFTMKIFFLIFVASTAAQYSLFDISQKIFGIEKIDDTEKILKELQEINQNITIWNEEADQNHNKIERLQNVMNEVRQDMTRLEEIVENLITQQNESSSLIKKMELKNYNMTRSITDIEMLVKRCVNGMYRIIDEIKKYQKYSNLF